MMEALKIESLRRGADGRNRDAPNAASLRHESKANPYPDLPDPLTLKNGEKVASPEQWWNKRRPNLASTAKTTLVSFTGYCPLPSPRSNRNCMHRLPICDSNYKYWIVAVQSGWYPNRMPRIIRGQPIQEFSVRCRAIF